MNERHQRGGASARRIFTLAGIMACLLSGLIAMSAFAQGEPAAAGAPSKPSIDCARCHTCDRPTHDNPCFIPCTRATVDAIAREFAGKTGPDLVIMRELEDRYVPVPFDHKEHARWTEIMGGCGVCHHYTPEGAEHPACKTCHEVKPEREDIRKPGLKGAYHRQCMGCHREWSRNTKCVLCHALKPPSGETVPIPTLEDLKAQMPPPTPVPDTEIYETKSVSAPGTKAIFRHKEHAYQFGFECADCHRGDSCARCHGEVRVHTQQVRAPGEHHKDCSNCHDTKTPDECDRCHWEEGKPMPKPFDHGDTGWALNRYHKGKNCRLCHMTVPFTKLDRDCNKCHDDWEPDEFDHAVTGQVLDENHADVDCGDCHADRRFDRAPSCDECHDEDVSFPAQRPGPVVTPKTPAND